MEKKCGVYFRGDDVYVVTMCSTTIGIWIGTDPRFKLKRTDSAAALGRTVREAFNSSREGIPTPEDLRSVGADLAKFAGFKTLSSFQRGATYFFLTLTENRVNIVPTTRGSRGGFAFLPDEAVECKADAHEVGEALMKLARERQS